MQLHIAVFLFDVLVITIATVRSIGIISLMSATLPLHYKYQSLTQHCVVIMFVLVVIHVMLVIVRIICSSNGR